jgi:hypothetical protein
MPSVRIPQSTTAFESVVSVPVVASAAAVRAALESLGWEFERRKSTRLYSKFAFILTLPKAAHVFQFVVSGPPAFTVETWQTDIAAGALMTFLRVEGVRVESEGDLRAFLAAYRTAAGKDPWRFTAGERSRAGYLLPEFARAKKAWAKQGFATGRERRR